MTLRWSPGYAAVDEYFDSVSLLLHGDGTNGSTTIVDSSPSPKTMTAVGNAQISTAQSKFGGASLSSFSTYNAITTPGDVAFDFGTGDFTVECWVYPEAITGTYGMIFATTGSNTVGHLGLLLSPIGTALLITYVGNENRPGASAAGVNTNQWNHIAGVRSGNIWSVAVNGVFGSPVSISKSLISTTVRLFSNADESGNGRLYGYIDEMRVTKGVARYTSNFTPPTAPFPDLSPTTRLTLP